MSCEDKKHTHHHECKEEHEHKYECPEEHAHHMPHMPMHMPKPCMPMPASMPMPLPTPPRPSVMYHYHFFVNPITYLSPIVPPVSVQPIVAQPTPTPPPPALVPPTPVPPIPTPPTPPLPPIPACKWYIVRPGDTMFSIAQANNIPLSVLIAANPQITNPNLIYPGQQICIPLTTTPVPTCNWYIVRPGDTMFNIARANNIPLSVLIAANPQISNPDLIFPGQQICIPTGTTIPTPIMPISETLPTPIPIPVPVPTLLPAPIPITMPAPIPTPLPTPVPTPIPAPLPTPVPMPMPIVPPVVPAPIPPVVISPITFPPVPVPPLPVMPVTPTPVPIVGTEPAITMPAIETPATEVPEVVAGATTGTCTWYIVKPGDTMYKIAKANNIPLSTLIAANPQITNPNMIMPGQQICIPTNTSPSPICEQIHVIKQGDTMFRIAKLYGIPLETLISANPQITNPDLIYPGQEICIPGKMMG